MEDNKNPEVHVEKEKAEDVEDVAEATADSPDTGGAGSVLPGEPPRGVTGTATGTDAATWGRTTMGSEKEVKAAEYDDVDEEEFEAGDVEPRSMFADLDEDTEEGTC